ncbi:MAG TPA: glycoside hydrolase family 28 protein [Bacteroides sp.]|nr:glycoside hydrolase family 28 protein [Bacteroides sp.]
MRKSILLFVSTVCLSGLLLNANAQYDVKTFGATGDGLTLDTRSIQSAIDKAHENGGGIVEIPVGTYKIGTLILKDNINLHLQTGSVLLGSPDYQDYPEIIHNFDSRTNGLYAKYFMIFAEGAHNISITGEGTINGNGLENYQLTRPQNLRPFMIRLVDCKMISIKDVFLLESANWTLHLLGCTDVNIDGIMIKTTAEGNRDGIDIDASQRVRIANCQIIATDDAIVMKASCEVVSQDITITNCILSSGGSAIKAGTESNGGFKNISISNCVIKDIDNHAGIELMTVDGGIMQNIVLENLTMDNVATPLFIRIGLRSRPYKPGQYVSKIDDVKDIYLNNITVINAKLPSSIIGLHHKKIKNISINNYSVRYVESQESRPYNEVPFEEFSYPMAIAFKNLPAYGLYCRNVEDLHLENVSMYSVNSETRPALTFDRVNDLELISVKAEIADQSATMIHLRNTENVFASFCRSRGVSNSIFEIEENTCSNLHFSNNIIQDGQVETATVEALPDEHLFNDFPTEIKYSVDKGENIQGLTAHDLNGKALSFNLDMTKRGSLQLRLLILNDSNKPEKVLVKYEGITQEFRIDWNEWGWAPITLLKQYDKDKKVDFEIVSAEQNSSLKIAKVYLHYQDIAFTD